MQVDLDAEREAFKRRRGRVWDRKRAKRLARELWLEQESGPAYVRQRLRKATDPRRMLDFVRSELAERRGFLERREQRVEQHMAKSIAEWLDDQFMGEHPPCRAGAWLAVELYELAKEEGVTTAGMHGFFYNNFRPAVQRFCGVDDLGYVYSDVMEARDRELEEEPDDVDQEEELEPDGDVDDQEELEDEPEPDPQVREKTPSISDGVSSSPAESDEGGPKGDEGGPKEDPRLRQATAQNDWGWRILEEGRELPFEAGSEEKALEVVSQLRAANPNRHYVALSAHVIPCRWDCGRAVDPRVYPELVKRPEGTYNCGICDEGRDRVHPSTPHDQRTNPFHWVDQANAGALHRLQEEEAQGPFGQSIQEKELAEQRERNRELARRIEELARLRRKEAHPPEDPFVMYVSGPWGQLMIERAEGGDRARLEGYLPDDLVDELVGEVLSRYYPLGE